MRWPISDPKNGSVHYKNRNFLRKNGYFSKFGGVPPNGPPAA